MVGIYPSFTVRSTSLAIIFNRKLLMGRHLLELGMKPGREIGVVLEAAFEAQLEGKFFDLPQAMRWLASEPAMSLPDEVRSRLKV